MISHAIDDLFSDSKLNEGVKLHLPGFSEAVHVATASLLPLHGGALARINIENRHLLSRVGLTPGVSVNIEYGEDFLFVRKLAVPEWDSLTIAPKHYANRDGSTSVGCRLDIRRAKTAGVFRGETGLLITYTNEGVLISLLPTRMKARGRWAQLLRAINSGSIRTGSAFSGIGTLDSALHAGLQKSGLGATNEYVNDNWDEAVEAMLSGDSSRPRRTYSLGIEQLVTLSSHAGIPQVDLLALGIPCKSSSRLNVQSRDLPEMHAQVGHQVLNVAMLLQSLKWETPIVLIENVVAWSETVSCSMLRKIFEEQGYKTELIGPKSAEGKYQGLNGNDYGDFERRRRMALIAYPPELEQFLAFGEMAKSPNLRTIGSIRAPEETIDPADYERGPGMIAKEARGWHNRIVSNDETSTPSCSSDCWKIRPEDPKFTSPDKPGKWRLPTPEEHARLKGQPIESINTLRYDTAAHTALGNGTCRKVWVEFSRCLGVSLQRAVGGHIQEL